jgi:hypothetical protein
MTQNKETPAPPPKNKGGRPRMELDADLIKKLAEMQCTMNEIASCVGCSVDTLEARYSDIIKNGREVGKCSLRRIQWRHAVNNPSMAIFLGKVHLGQKDNAYDAPQYSKIIVERGGPSTNEESVC